MANTKTLEEAFQGLMNYWTFQPDGGTRAELLSLAVQNGFEEPLLAEWLDEFLLGMHRIGVIESATYPAMRDTISGIGLPRARDAARAVFAYFTVANSPDTMLETIHEQARLDVQIIETQAAISGLSAHQALRDSARSAIVAVSGVGFTDDVKAFLIHSIDRADVGAAGLLAQTTEELAQLVAARAVL